MRPYQKQKWWIVLFIIISVSGIGGWAIAQVANNEITACIKLSNGSTRILIPGSGDSCTNNEQAVVWNIQGIQGEPGVKGDKGDARKQVRVKDSQGSDIGQLVSLKTDTAWSYAVFNEQLGMIFNIERPNSESMTVVPAIYQPYYESNDCSGVPLINFDSSNTFLESVVNIPTSDKYFRIATNTGQVRDIHSRNNGTCETNAYGEIFTYGIEQVTLPLMAWPLFLVSE